VALHEYNVRAAGRNQVDTTMLLSDEDAEAMGLTSKDRVSAKAANPDALDDEFKPRTEADLDVHGKEAAEAAVRAAQAREAQVAEEQRAQVEAAKVEAKRVTDAQKAAKTSDNKQVKSTPNKQADSSATK
jgi:hypothetical protein